MIHKKDNSCSKYSRVIGEITLFANDLYKLIIRIEYSNIDKDGTSILIQMIQYVNILQFYFRKTDKYEVDGAFEGSILLTERAFIAYNWYRSFSLIAVQ